VLWYGIIREGSLFIFFGIYSHFFFGACFLLHLLAQFGEGLLFLDVLFVLCLLLEVLHLFRVAFAGDVFVPVVLSVELLLAGLALVLLPFA
jgi:hypothetical protein